MKKNDQDHGWEQVRKLPPELELDVVLKHIQSFPASPPARRWTDYLTFKTKWIMLLSALSIFVFVFNFWSDSELVRRGATAGADSSAERNVVVTPQKAMGDRLTNKVARLTIKTEVDAPPTTITAAINEEQFGISPGSIVDSVRTVPSVASAKPVAALTSTSDRRSSTTGSPELADSLAPVELPVMTLTSSATLLTKEEQSAVAEKLLTLEKDSHRQPNEETFNRLPKGGNPKASPPNWGTSCAELGRHDQALPPFNRAVIKGNIRVVIRKGEANTMTTIAYPGKEQLVTAEVKDGVLYLTGPKKQNRSWNYDIQLTATDLSKVKAKTKTCVWLDGQRALNEVEGKLCPTRNFEEWVE